MFTALQRVSRSSAARQSFSQIQLIAAGTKQLGGQPCRVLSSCSTSGDDGFRGSWAGWLSLAGAGITSLCSAMSNLLCTVLIANGEEV